MADDLSVTEVADAIGATISAVQKAIVRGTLAATRVPGPKGGYAYRVTRGEVDRYLVEHRRLRRV